MDTTCGTRNDPRGDLYILLSGAEGGRPTARATRQARDEELAAFFRKAQEQIVVAARERLARSELERENPSLPSQQPSEGVLVEFAVRAAKRLQNVAVRLEESGSLEGDGETLARAQELRVAAFMVRDEAEVMARRIASDPRRGRHPLQAADEPDQSVRARPS